jgi:hypothetical protein
MTSELVGSALALTQELSRFLHRFRQFAGVFTGALRALRTSAAFAADDWRDLLD